MRHIFVILGCISMLTAGCGTPLPDTSEAVAPAIYVMAGAASGGDGSKATPFNTLADAESASNPGDTIYIMAAPDNEPLDGGITLKPDQKLLGIDPDGQSASPRLTNTTENLDGDIVRLSSGNEVSGLHFVDMQGHAVHGFNTNYSGAHIHHNRFTGAVESEDVIPGILLEADSGDIEDIRVTDCIFRDGEDLAGIRVMHTGSSTGNYLFERNDFSDIGGRAYLIWSRGESRIQSRILDSVADNIGRGDRNADSIDPRLWGHSTQTMFVSNYHYNNTKQVGSRSNTGFEAFIMGEPFRDEEEWCDGCRLTLEIVDSVFENTITDGIQLTNYGSNSVLEFTIRNTKIIGANPQQAGGAISLIAQNQYNTGSTSKLLVENCDIIDSGKYGFAILDRSGEYTSTVDLGGGALGSTGGNRIINSAEAEILVTNANPIAKYNWWGENEPRIEIQGDKSTIELTPQLKSDPRKQ